MGAYRSGQGDLRTWWKRRSKRKEVMWCYRLLSCSLQERRGWWFLIPPAELRLHPAGTQTTSLCSPPSLPLPVTQIPIQFPANQHVDRTSQAAGLLANYRKSFCSTAQCSGREREGGISREQAPSLQAGNGLQAESWEYCSPLPLRGGGWRGSWGAVQP